MSSLRLSKDSEEYERDTLRNNAKLNPKEKEIHLDSVAVAPSPSRDYYRIYVTTSEVALTQWRISHGPRSVPIELKIPLENFAKDYRMHSEVSRIFGNDCVDYITGLSHGHVDKIMHLPSSVLAKIFFYTGIEYLKNFAPVCKKFAAVSLGDDLWKRFYLQYGGTDATKNETKYQADYLSWKHLFFINRLQYKIENLQGREGLFPELMSMRKGPRLHQAQSPSPSTTSVPSRRHIRDTSSARKITWGRTARIVDGNIIPRASATNLLNYTKHGMEVDSPRQKATRYTLVTNSKSKSETRKSLGR